MRNDDKNSNYFQRKSQIFPRVFYVVCIGRKIGESAGGYEKKLPFDHAVAFKLERSLKNVL